jgi:large subunit ribosomal protein L14
MKPVDANITKALPLGSKVATCDNSGAKILKIFSVKKARTVKGQNSAAGVGDLVKASVVRGRPDMRKTTVWAVIVRQKKEYKRADGTRVQFEDNAAVVLKDDEGNPKGTIYKGPIAKEATERWPGIAKVASIII